MMKGQAGQPAQNGKLSGASVPRNERRRQGWALFAGVLILYVVTASGQIRYWDGNTMLRSARALVARGSWELTPEEARGLFGVVESRGLQGKFAPGYTIALIPGIVIGQALASVLPLQGLEGHMVTFPAALTNALFMALTVLVIWHSLLALGLSERRAVAFSLAYALASPAFVYAKYGASEALAMLLVALCFHGLILWSATLRARHCVEVVLAAGGAGLTRYPLMLLLLIVIPGVLLAAPRQRRARALVVMVVSILPLMGLLAWNNAARFGSPFVTGYGLEGQSLGNFCLSPFEVAYGALGITVSPARGLFVYAPVLAFALLCGRPRHREHLTVVAVGVITFVAFAVLFGAYWHLIYMGPINIGAWGSRFILPVLPVAMLLAALGYENLPGCSWRKRVLIGLFLIGFVVNLPGVLMNWHRADRGFRFLQANGEQFSEWWSLRTSPILLQWQAVAHLVGFGRYPPAQTPEARYIRNEIENAPNLSMVDFWWVYYLFARDHVRAAPTDEQGAAQRLPCLVPSRIVAAG